MTTEQDRLYKAALLQAETSRKFGKQARQECSTEDAIAITGDYVRVVDELEQTKDRWVEMEEKFTYAKGEIQALYGRVGAAKRANNDLKKLNNTLTGESIAQEKIIENQCDTIVELTLQLDSRDVQ